MHGTHGGPSVSSSSAPALAPSPSRFRIPAPWAPAVTSSPSRRPAAPAHAAPRPAEVQGAELAPRRLSFGPPPEQTQLLGHRDLFLSDLGPSWASAVTVCLVRGNVPGSEDGTRRRPSGPAPPSSRRDRDLAPLRSADSTLQQGADRAALPLPLESLREVRMLHF